MYRRYIFASRQTAAAMAKNRGRQKTGERYGKKNLQCDRDNTAGHMHTVGIQTLKRAVCVLGGERR